MCSPSATDVFGSFFGPQRGASCRATVCAERSTPASQARTGEYPSFLDNDLVAALRRRGIAAPYDHQVEAWQALAGGRSVIVATPTASGKSLCYNVPVASRLLADPEARALFLFPTKALSRDQELTIRALLNEAGCSAEVAVYDGDTPASQRRRIRDSARVLLTNPDMLHAGILPYHPSWARFLSGLSIVVVDELHIYRGVFGAHVANVLRRLKRIARFHGAAPVFAAATATIANPVEHATAILEEDPVLIDRSGAPSCERLEIILDPGFADPLRGIRRSTLGEAARLATALVEAGRTTLVFCESRRSVEVVLRHVRRKMERSGLDSSAARGYRGGYLPGLRREIEAALKAGELTCVVATSALELGIDVGELDAVVLAGYPGTVAAYRQRAGRAGRRDRPALCALVVGGGALDQYLARHPAKLFDTSPERAMVRPNNVEILLRHLVCAAFELSFTDGEAFGGLSVEETDDALSLLAAEERLQRAKNRYVFLGDSSPAREISLRSSTSRRFVLYDIESGEHVAEVDEASAKRELHPGAVYQMEGRTFQVETLDLDAGLARVRAVLPHCYTVPFCDTRLAIVDERASRALAGGRIGFGDVTVRERVTSYKRVRMGSHENLGTSPVELPASVLETEALWLEPAPQVLELMAATEAALLGAFGGLAHALLHIAALRLMCDPRDLGAHLHPGRASGSASADLPEGPALFLFDAHAGGAGLTEVLSEQLEDALDEAAALVWGCGCAAGCPACVGPQDEFDTERKALVRTLALCLRGLSPTGGLA